MKPPIQFLDLVDLQPETQIDASSTFAILDPTITIEKSNGMLEIAVRFNLEVKPYPVFSRESNNDWPHARFIDCVRLTHTISGEGNLLFEPGTSIEDSYTVTESTSSTGTVTAGGGIASLIPTANVAISIVKGGRLEAVSKITPWACNASYEPRTTEQRSFSWEWISNLGENPKMPDTAFRGMKWPVAVHRIVDEGSLQLSAAGILRTEEETVTARQALANLLHFDFVIQIYARELGYGGFSAHWEKIAHWLRPYRHPKGAYNPTRNRGRPTPKIPPQKFWLGPKNVNAVDEADLAEFEANLGPPGVDTDSLQDAKRKAHDDYVTSGICASHISTYTVGPAKQHPAMLQLSRMPEVVVEQMGEVKEKMKATYTAKTW